MKIKDPISGFSHLFGAILTIIGTIFLLTKTSSTIELVSCLIFGISAFVLYSSSAIYHLFGKPEDEISFTRKMDHASIYLLIAGTYTPMCTILVNNTLSLIILITIWTLAIIGISTIFLKFFWKIMPRWASTGIYILMGWISVILLYSMRSFPEVIFWIITGGIFYTIGSVIYIIKKPNISKHFGFHELFHIFILLGTISHFIAIFKIF
jgi:hemolysin III